MPGSPDSSPECQACSATAARPSSPATPSALDYLNQQDPGELSVGLVLHLHRLLFAFTEDRAGHFKTDDNLVVDRLPDGSREVRFEPVSAAETPFFMEELVARSIAALGQDEVHPLIVTAAFALDFLCIHPFGDGNGRVARLATSYLMGRTGYGVGRYVSLEQLIYDTKDDYYGALGASTIGWFDDGHHDLWPWARYLSRTSWRCVWPFRAASCRRHLGWDQAGPSPRLRPAPRSSHVHNRRDSSSRTRRERQHDSHRSR